MVLKESSLKSINRKLNWGQHKSMPMAQGESIKAVINRYNLPAISTGYRNNDAPIGIETKKQKLFWLNEGGSLKFLGILNK